jgi:hypothetical protein
VRTASPDRPLRFVELAIMPSKLSVESRSSTLGAATFEPTQGWTDVPVQLEADAKLSMAWYSLSFSLMILFVLFAQNMQGCLRREISLFNSMSADEPTCW